MQQALDVLNEYRRYCESEHITTSVFGEPWGHLRHIHLHQDFPNAGDAQEWSASFRDNPRAIQALRDLEGVVETDADPSMLVEYS